MQNKGDFFVMLTTQSGGYTPLVSDVDLDSLAKFETEAAASAAAQNSVLGSEFGYEVFQIGCGC